MENRSNLSLAIKVILTFVAGGALLAMGYGLVFGEWEAGFGLVLLMTSLIVAVGFAYSPEPSSGQAKGDQKRAMNKAA